MKTPLRPNDEALRLQVLREYNWLDTLPEPEFDELTTLVAHLCETPIALISLIDEQRQRFKSKVGLDICETSRDIFFCGHAILQRDLFIVPDATQDERFADNPFVTGEPHIRFYAGAPLITPEGQAIGTLSIIDRVSRQLTPAQQTTLRVLSRQVMARLELRRQARGSAQSERLLRAIFDSEPECVKLLGPDGALRMMNRAGLAMIEADSFAQVAGQCIYPLVAPEQRAEFAMLAGRVFRGESGTMEFQITGLKGTARWLEIHAAPLRDERGEVTALLGVTRDITEHKRAVVALQRTEQLYRRAIAGAGAVPYDYDYQSRTYGFMGAEIERLTGYRPEEFCPALWRQIIQECVMLGEAAGLSQTEASNRIMRGEIQQWCADARILTRDGKTRWLSDVSVQKHDAAGRVIGSTGILMDITERKHAEAALREKEHRLSESQRIGHIGSWSIDMAGHRTWSEEAYHLYGVSPDSPAPNAEAFLKLIHPDDRPAMQAWFRSCLAGEKPAELEYRAILPDGTVRFLSGRGELVYDAANRPLYAAGTVQDITARKQAEAALRASEDRYRRIVETAEEGIWMIDATARTSFVNPKMAQMLGYTVEEMQGRGLNDFMDEAGRAISAENLKRRQQGIAENQEFKFLRKDGSELWASLATNPVFDDSGTYAGTLAMVMDITERRQAERHIRRLNRVYSVLSDINQLIVREKKSQVVLEAICQIAVQKGKFQMAWIGMLNPETQTLRPVASSGVVEGYLDWLKIDLRDPTQAHKPAARCLLAGEHAICNDIARDPYYLPWRDEALRRGYKSSGGFPLKVEGQIVGAFNLYASEPGFFDEEELQLLDELAMDISFALDLSRREAKRAQAEAARDALLDLQVQLSTARVPLELARSIFGAADKLWQVDAGTLNVYLPEQDLMQAVVNFDVIEGKRQDVRLIEIIGKPTARIRRIMERGGELVLRQPPFTAPPDSVMFGDKSRVSASLMHVPIRWQGRAVGILSVQSYTPNAFTEADLRTLQGLADHCGGTLDRIRADAALRASEERFRELAGNINEVFWIIDANTRQIIYISPAYEKIWGRTCASLYAAPGAWLDAVHPEDRARIAQAAETKQARGDYEETYRILRPDGTERWIYDRAFPVRGEAGEMLRVVGTAEDITARRELEEQLRQSQKMEAIGQLAGGVAHDFNNILAALMMEVEFTCMSENPPEKVREGLQQIRSGLERAANLIRQLLLFSRRQMMQPRELDLNEVVTSLTTMLRRIIGEDVRLQLNLHSRPLTTVADSGMLDQVLLNLVVNAREAMPGGGRLTIETAAKSFTEEEAAALPDVKPGRHVCLRITDTGNGILPEHLPHIFEPFFTTKEPGKGTGLGLASVFGIVKQHGGAVAVESEVGKGTTFVVFLRAAESARDDKAPAAQQPRPTGGTETILLVEDEPSVRRLTRFALEQAGYQVLEAADGVEALRLAEQHLDRIQLLFTDVVMPEGVSGHELAARLQARNPKLKVIFTSGYSAEIAGRKTSSKAVQNFLQKPCPPNQILETVRRCLDA